MVVCEIYLYITIVHMREILMCYISNVGEQPEKRVL